MDLMYCMDQSGAMLTLPMLEAVCRNAAVTPFRKQVLQMPTLDLIMLVAMQRLEIKGSRNYNFHHIYDEYESMFTLHASSRTTIIGEAHICR